MNKGSISINKLSGRAIILLSLVIFFSCDFSKESKNNVIEPVDKYLVDSFEVHLNDTIPNNIGLVAVSGNKASFLHYYFSKVFNYDISKQVFESSYFIPREQAETPNLLEFYYPDSIIYYTMYSKKIFFCKGNKVIIEKELLDKYPQYYMYSRGQCINDQHYYYFPLYLRFLDKTMDYNFFNSKVSNFVRIKKDLSTAEILNLNYRIKETRNYQMVQNLILPVVINHYLIFCFDMVDTIYRYDLKLLTLDKFHGFSEMSFSTVFFNADTCKDIEITRNNLYQKSSSVSQMISDEKNNLLIRLLKMYDKVETTKKSYIQIFDKDIRLIKTLKIPDRYEPYLFKIQNGFIYLKVNNYKSNLHVYKKLSLDNLY